MDLNKIKFIESPNKTKGRTGKIEYIIIHSMAGYFLGSVQWFKNPKSKVSAHYLVSQKGEIVQMVKDTDTAWHCHGINYSSLGVEAEDLKDSSKPGWITPKLWEALVNLTAMLATKYNVPVEKIYTHGDPYIRKINGPKFAHNDPILFDIAKFRKEVKECQLSKIKKSTSVVKEVKQSGPLDTKMENGKK